MFIEFDGVVRGFIISAICGARSCGSCAAVSPKIVGPKAYAVDLAQTQSEPTRNIAPATL
jgi:cytochrome c551/c552